MVGIKTCEALAVIQLRRKDGFGWWNDSAVYRHNCTARIDENGQTVSGQCGLDYIREIHDQYYSDEKDYICLCHPDFSGCGREYVLARLKK